MTAVHIALLLEVDLPAVLVNDPILEISQRLVCDNLNASPVATAPFAGDGEHSLFDVSLDKRMDVENEFLYLQAIDEIIKFFVKLVCEQQRRLHLTLTEA